MMINEHNDPIMTAMDNVKRIHDEILSRGEPIRTVIDARDLGVIAFTPSVWMGERTLVGDITPSNVKARNYRLIKF